MKYAAQLYTLREALETDFLGTFKRVADIGLTRVEPFGIVDNAARLEEAFKETGLSAPSGHAQFLTEDQDAIFKAAQSLGITTVIDPYIPADQWATAADIETTAGKLNEAARKSADFGIRVGYHNHFWELQNTVAGVTALEYLAQHLDPGVILEVDTYWAAVGGADPVALLTTLGDRVRMIHIKDGPIDENGKAQLPAGKGRMPIPEILAAVPHIELGVIEFDDYSGDLFTGIAESLDFLNTLDAEEVDA